MYLISCERYKQIVRSVLQFSCMHEDSDEYWHFLYISEKRRTNEGYYPLKRAILPSFLKKMQICKLSC